ncbi:MAG: glycosyltransferase family 4 protein [Acidobacteriota bacterium]
MKQPAVCIVVENLPVPMDRRVWKEARALRDAGYRVSVVCPKGTGAAAASHEVLDGIAIYRHRRMEASGVLGYVLEYGWALAAECYLVLKVFARTRFRILQACNPPDTIFLIALLLRLFGVRFVFDHHDLSPELFETKFGRGKRMLHALVRFCERCSFRAAKVSIATNDSFKEIAVSRGGKRPEDVFVVRNCSELNGLHHVPLAEDARRGKKFLVLYVGFMGPQDGLPLLIEAIDQIVNGRARRDTQFVLIGGGSELASLKAGVAARGLDPFVTFTGQISYDVVTAYLSRADIGVAPDPKTPMNDNSTMIKILEYMAYGVPIVQFDLKEGRRIAGPAALYATADDPSEFAAQVNRLLDDEALRRELGANGRRRVEQSLNWENEKVSLLQAYEAALR